MAARRKAAGDQDGTGQKDQHVDDVDDEESLLDPDESDDDADDDLDEDEDDDADDDDADDDSKVKGKRKAPAAFDEEALLAKVESRIDRRLNAVLREIRKPATKAPARGTGAPAARSSRQQQEPEPEVPEADVRGARLAFRDELAETKFISPVERRFALDLGQTLIRARALDGFADEDVVGREVAEQVAKTVKDLRTHYEKQVKAALRRRGLLPEQKDGQSPGGGTGGGTAAADSELAKGKELAAQRHARPGAH